jgi:hypothetical protein
MYLVAVFAVAIGLLFAVDSETLAASLTIGWIVVSLVPFIRFCQARTNGAWRWRWGSGQ